LQPVKGQNMSRVNRSNLSNNPKNPRRRRSPLRLILTIIVFVLVVGGVFLVGGFIYLNLSAASRTADPSLDPLDAAALSAYLILRQGDINQPVDPAADDIHFEVLNGQGAVEISQNLFSQRIITDAELFRRYAQFYGYDRQFTAGIYRVSASMSIPELMIALVESDPVEITIRITEGWRREQIADWLDTQSDVPFTGADFLAATDSVDDVPPGNSVSGDLAGGTTLEGFLFPDTYRLDIDATADELVARMVTNFDTRVTPQMRSDALAQGLDMYEVVTLASIVEREAVDPDERPRVASVYLNRLAIGQLLQADPTVQYAQGYQADTGQWWNLNLTAEDYSTVISPYNTYLNAGLPPGPIANPGLGSIEAVIYPESTDYLYFRATCDGSGRHSFAVTFEEHVANACF